MAPNQSLLFYLQTTSLDRKQQMIASTAQVARFIELQKQKMIIDVIAESTIFKTPLEDGAVEPQSPLLRVTQGDLEAWYEIIDKLPKPKEKPHDEIANKSETEEVGRGLSKPVGKAKVRR
jgi:hypothetical protein